MENVDLSTVDGFGREWNAVDQSGLGDDELQRRFNEYFSVFRWDLISPESVGFDMGCGSGRWDKLLAPKVGLLHCIDPSSAIDVARRNLASFQNIQFHQAGVGDGVLPSGSMDFGISIGVLHHVPDTFAAIRSCVDLLKPGAPLLLYLYYRFDNRPLWFRAIWQCADGARRIISRLPYGIRRFVCAVIAGSVYWPASRCWRLLERAGFRVDSLPLAYYRNTSWYTLRTDALDRFGTKLERRFTQSEIRAALEAAGCREIVFSPSEPYWCVCAVKSSANA